MTRSLPRALAGLAALGLVLSLAGCRQPVVLDLARGQAHLAVTDPTLADNIQTYLVAKLTTDPGVTGCPRLVDLRIAELDGLLQRQPFYGAVAAFRLDRRTGYGFGKVEPAGDWSFVMLGSTKELFVGGGVAPDDMIDAREPLLPQVEGSVIAIGCRELSVEEDGRYDMSVTLFPAGLR